MTHGSAGEPSRRHRRLVGAHRNAQSRAVLRQCGLVAFLVLLTVTGASLATAATPRSPVFGPDHKVIICHFNNGEGGRWIPISVDVASIVKGTGHGAHRNDIIPEFDYNIGAGPQTYRGKNWTSHVLGSNTITGQDVWNQGACDGPKLAEGTIKPKVECVLVDHATDTYEAVFGYSANLVTSPVTIPAGGGDNDFSPGIADRGQPSEFFSGDDLASVTVKNLTIGESLTWTVTFNGHREEATATSDLLGSGIASCDEQPPPDLDSPIGLFVTCVVNHGATYDAIFGYQSTNDSEEIPVGPTNRFSPGDEDRGQPTTFLTGVHDAAVVVKGIHSNIDLTWNVNWIRAVSTTATPDFEIKCEEAGGGTPTPPPGPPTPPTGPQPLPIGVFATCVTHHGSHYDATFGYSNDNADVVSVPIGSDNAISPGTADQGQPDMFQPGFFDRVFTIHGVRTPRAVRWRVSFAGEVRVATATASLPSCVTAPLDPVANAAVRKTATPHTVKVGNNVTFTIDVRNTGSKVLQPAAVTDTLPASQLRVLSATSTLGRCHVTTSGGSHRVRCSASALAPGQSFTIHVTARATAGGTASDHAAVVGVRHAVASAAVHISGPSPRPAPPFTG